MKSNNNNNDDDDDDNNNNTAMGSVHARGDTFLTFGLKALAETNTSRLVTDTYIIIYSITVPRGSRRRRTDGSLGGISRFSPNGDIMLEE
jgi:hypothetical protein